MHLVLCLVISVCLFPLNAWAASDNGYSYLYLGTSLVDFTYKEFTDKGKLLDREDGLIPGVLIGINYQKENIFTDLSFRYTSANIQYDGQTQLGTPVKTVSDADIYDVEFRFGGELTDNRYTYKPYMGIGYHSWERNIRTSAIAYGVFENYKWTYFLLGTEIDLFHTNKSDLAIDLRYTSMIDADIFVELAPYGYDNINLALGKEDAYRIGLPLKIKANNTSNWIIEPYYEKWFISKSEIKQVTSGGSPTGVIIWEPKSKTKNYGISIKVQIPF